MTCLAGISGSGQPRGPPAQQPLHLMHPNYNVMDGEDAIILSCGIFQMQIARVGGLLDVFRAKSQILRISGSVILLYSLAGTTATQYQSASDSRRRTVASAWSTSEYTVSSLSNMPALIA